MKRLIISPALALFFILLPMISEAQANYAPLRQPLSTGQWEFRQANTPAVVAVAARVVTEVNGTVSAARIALGAAGPHPLRARQAEAALLGKPLDTSSIAAAAHAAQAECDPPTDALASSWYRRRMVGVYVRRALENCKL